ncbi:MAG: hypothetical protein VCB25_01370, partial [Myxococcota bacterium]
MTASTSAVPTDSNGPELAGSWIDALFGYGLLYLLSVPLIFWLARSQGMEAWPAGVAGLLALVISGPHYAATILRVYEKRRDRRKYAFFAVWVTALLSICFVVSLYSEPFGSWILTAYVCWSPWHFAGQNFGVSMMSLRRRAVPIDELSRRLLHGSFILAFLLSIVSMQTGGTRSEVALGADGANVYHVIRLGIAPDVSLIILWIVGLVYLSVTIGALIRLGRGHQTRHLGPTILLMATHSLWYVLPVISANRIPLIYSAVWVSTIHSLQYLWVTSYYAKRTAGKRGSTFYWQCLLVGGVLAVTLQLIFAPGLLGRFIPFASDAGIMVFSTLNLHHFILDGAIWKLRDGRVGRILLNQSTVQIETNSASSRRGFLRPAIYTIGALSLMTPFYFFAESRLAINSESHTTTENAAGRLSFWGKEIPGVHAAVARHRNLAGNADGAIDAFRRELALEPNNPIAAGELAGLLLDDPRGARESLALASYASEAMGDSNPVVLIILGSARARVGQRESAQAAFLRAEQIAVTQGRS